MMFIDSLNSVNTITINTNPDRSKEQTDKDKLIKTDPNHIQLNVKTTKDNITKAVEKVNEKYMADNKKLEYSYHEKSGRFVIKVIEKDSNKIINQIPAQKLLDYAEGLMEYIGINIDKKV